MNAAAPLTATFQSMHRFGHPTAYDIKNGASTGFDFCNMIQQAYLHKEERTPSFHGHDIDFVKLNLLVGVSIDTKN